MRVSVIATVKNERETIASWFDSILMQDMANVDYVIVDGGSNDGTWEWLQEKATSCKELRIAQVVGGRSKGRNEAIQRALGDIIVAADAGCRYESGWLTSLIAPFSAEGAEVVAGAYGPWFMSTDTLQHYLFAASTTPAPQEFKKDWLPSSRSVAFTRKRFEESGGYPEWLPICEDIVFDLALKKTGAVFRYCRTPLVFWRPQSTLTRYMKQLYRYTRGDGHANLWLYRQLIRYGVYGTALTLCVFFSQGIFLAGIPIALLGACTYMKKFWVRFCVFAKPLTASQQVLGFVFLPFVVALGDVAKMGGYIVGTYQRVRGQVRMPGEKI